MTQAKFKPYSRQQIPLLPATYEDKIPANHPVRIVDVVVEKIDLRKLYSTYKGGGTSSHNPKMLLKAIIYAYITNTYSSRKIEEAIKSDVRFIWLCGNCEPDHNTINRFRGEKVSEVLKDIFKQLVLLLAEEGLVSLKDAYVDGTKIEANANRYTFVWGNAIKTSKERMIKQLDELWEYAQGIAKEELKDTAPLDFKTIDADKVKETVQTIEEAIKDKEVSKKVKQKLTYAKKNFPAKLDQYKVKEEILEGRHSYSKTDNDATFMRMKEDHMKKWPTKAWI
jgi:transposase